MKARILSALFLVQFSVLLGVLIGHSLWVATAESSAWLLYLPVLFLGIIAFFATIEED